MPEPFVKPVTDYESAREWLYDRIDYERVKPGGTTNPFRLERIGRLLQLIGAPQERIPSVHIAGTKGKGSTAAMVEAILRQAGLRTGLFTSPHIEFFEERMRVSGVMPSRNELTELVQQLTSRLDQATADGAILGAGDRLPTFFEVTTLLAWMLFDRHRIDVAVLETGLGGRLDCTNVCNPLVTIITSIGLDHTHILGNTLAEIAAEKAGILKPGVPVIVGRLPTEARDVVLARAERLGCQVHEIGQDFGWTSDPASVHTSSAGTWTHDPEQVVTLSAGQHSWENVRLPLLGDHQAANAAAAAQCAQLLRETGRWQITDANIVEGLAKTEWPLRFEIIRHEPLIILDAAHNPDSVVTVGRTIDATCAAPRPRVLVFASSADKDAATMLSLLLPTFDVVVLTRFVGNPRSLPLDELQRAADPSAVRAGTRVFRESDPDAAMARARELAGSAGLICVTGSMFLAAEVRILLKRRPE